MGLYDGLTCPICSKEFEDGDDVVVCPQCGAPHHRQCWVQHGECAFAADHGTEHQWKRPRLKSEEPDSDAEKEGLHCPRCGYLNDDGTLFCIKCGMPLQTGNGQKNTSNSSSWSARGPVVPNPLGGVNPNETIDGIPVGDIAAFVGNNSYYYIPRFVAMAKDKSKITVNWAAALLMQNWVAFRKMGGIFAIVAAIVTLINIPSFIITLASSVMMMPDVANYQTILFQPSNAVIVASYIMPFVALLMRIFLALFGNRLYMNYVIKRIHKLKEAHSNPMDYQNALLQKGGISWAFPIIYLVVFSVVIGMISVGVTFSLLT